MRFILGSLNNRVVGYPIGLVISSDASKDLRNGLDKVFPQAEHRVHKAPAW